MSERFFIETPICGGRATLTGPEAHHLLHVMRAARGDRVVLFDGSGWEFSAVVEVLGRDRAELRVVAREEVDRELSRKIVLGVALPKGQRQKFLVEKAVELGVKCLMPLRIERAVAQPDRGALERLRRTVIEASKQCGRNRLMEIAAPRAWPDFVEATRNESCRLLAHLAIDESPVAIDPQLVHVAQTPRDSGPGGGKCPQFPPGLPSRGVEPCNMKSLRLNKVVLAVGPEGGWTDDEVALAVAAGWHIVSLGRRILRVETAALLLTAWTLKN